MFRSYQFVTGPIRYVMNRWWRLTVRNVPSGGALSKSQRSVGADGLSAGNGNGRNNSRDVAVMLLTRAADYI